MLPKKLTWTITAIPLILAIIHLLWPDLKIDGITVALILIAAVPWLSPLLRSIEFPGGYKIEFKDIKNASEKIIAGMTLTTTVSKQYAEMLRKIAEDDPNLALVSLRIEIEKRIYNLVETQHIAFTNRSLRQLLTELKNAGILPGSISLGIEDLIIYGNKAAHGAQVSTAAVILALDAGPQILAILDEILKKTKKKMRTNNANLKLR